MKYNHIFTIYGKPHVISNNDKCGYNTLVNLESSRRLWIRDYID